MLSRQSSFEQEDGSRLTSAEVKQRLKHHLLNRNKHVISTRHITNDHTYRLGWKTKSSNMADVFASTRSPPLYMCGANWYSAESAAYPTASTRRFEFPQAHTSRFHHSIDLPCTTEVSSAHVRSNENAFTPSPDLSMPPLGQLNPNVISLLKQIVCSTTDNPNPPYADNTTTDQPNFHATVKRERQFRKTISEPDLMEPDVGRPRPGLVRQKPVVNCAPPVAIDQRSINLCDALKEFHLVENETEQLPLEELTDYLLKKLYRQSSSRPPLECSASEDSPLDKVQSETRIRDYLLNLVQSVGLHNDHSAQPPSSNLTTHPHSSSSTTDPHNVLITTPADGGMDWESDPASNQRQLAACSGIPADFKRESADAIITSPTFPCQNRVLSMWSELPVEDWTSDKSDSGRTVVYPKLTDLPTALAFDPLMLKHHCICASPDIHPECPQRMWPSLERLTSSFLQIPPYMSDEISSHSFRHLWVAVVRKSPHLTRELDFMMNDPQFLHSLLPHIPLVDFCQLLRARSATSDELCLFHSADHVMNFSRSHMDPHTTVTSGVCDSVAECNPTMPRQQQPACLCKLPCGGVGVDSDTIWNPESTSLSARLAVGQVLCLAFKLAHGLIRNGFALIRPPGHHAEPDQAMGFCYFNSVAVAASYLSHYHPSTKVLVLDWDIHHGNGTKFSVLQNPNLVYISIHRHDQGTFFPGTGSVHGGSGLTVMPTRLQHDKQEVINDHLHASQGRLINIAWQASYNCDSPFDQFSYRKLDASNRRERWRQLYQRRYKPVDKRLSTGFAYSTNGSSGSSLQSYAFPGKSDFCTCRSTLNSSGSNQYCSSCYSGSPSVYSNKSSNDTAFLDTHEHTRRTSAQSCESTVQPMLGLGDAEYLAAMRCVILPITYEFQPDIILVSAGFDAAVGHGSALGGYQVSPGMFAWMTRQCMSFANGKVILALEGGYNPSVVGDCVIKCTNALLLPSPVQQWDPCLGIPVEPDVSNQPPITNTLGAFEDAYQSALAWISPSELSRVPHIDAVDNLLSTIKFQAVNGWESMKYVSEVNVALSFQEAIKLERQIPECRKQRHTLVQKDSHSLNTWHTDNCASPLANGLAKLNMDQS